MKKIPFLLALAALLGACNPRPQMVCNAPFPGACSDPHVAHWPLNETPGATSVADTVANPIFNTGTAKPGPVQSIPNPGGPWSVQGHTGRALYFPGRVSYVEVPSTPDLTPARWILAAWVAPVQCGAGVYYPVVDKWDPTTQKGYSLYLEGVGSGQVRVALRLNGSTFTSTTSFPANYGTWTEVQVKVDGTMGSFFVNGTPAGTFTAPTGSLANSTPLWIGALHEPPPGMGHCEIALDEVRLDKIPDLGTQ